MYYGSSYSTSSSSPTPASSRIRFDDNPQYIEPPSPYTMTPVSSSTPSLYPSAHPVQPTGRSSQSTSSLSNLINPLLQYRNPACLRVGFYSTSREVRYRPNSNDPLAEPALAPHIQVNTIAIMASDLPWTINVAAPPNGPRTMTVGHVLTGLLQSLETRVTQDEFLRDSPAKRTLIQRNFTSRCAFVCKKSNTRLEENDDWNRSIVRRGDYLGGWSFRGLSVHKIEGTTVVMRMHYAPTSSH